ncbi:MAG: DUF4097 domain-containing protein [Lachnospiraceae bacterium]|nr:DUF4097 domain-containing protein [Lachnospiraceae bacterium]
MDRLTRVVLIILVAGIALIIIGALMSGGKVGNVFGSFGTNYVKKEFICNGPIDKLDVNELSERVEVRRGDVDTATVVYHEPEGQDTVEVSESGGTLRFKRNNNLKITFHIGFETEDISTVITLPKDFDGEVDVSCSSGAIDISDLELKKDFTAKASSGGIRISDIECENFDVSCTSGAIKVEDIECKDASVECTSGAIKVDKVKADGNFSTKNTSGGVKATNIECNDFTAETHSGLLKFNDVEAKGSFYAKATSGGVSFDDIKSDSIVLKSTSGSIRGTIDGKESDYSIISSTTSGSCNLKDSRGGSKTLDASTTSGGIHVNFK